MNKSPVFPLFAGLFLFPAAALHAQNPVIPEKVIPAPSSSAIRQVVDRVRPSLVRIHVVEGVPEGGRETKQESFGSGVIISPDGYVVTNHHVAGNARWLSVTLADKQEVSARLVGTDPLADIAVIQLAPSPTGEPYPAVSWGDSSVLRVGDPVLAMGSPLAFSQSVTSGIVSNTELIFPAQMGDAMVLEGEDVGSIVRWIGHDARIFPGNSGGPLVSLSGEVIGINEIGVGLSGAIPGNIARAVAAQLITQGHATRAFTGLDLQPRLRSLPASTKPISADDPGVLVGGVLPGSPAAQAGIRSGDLLLRANGTVLAARYPEQLPLVNLVLTLLPVGKPVTVEGVRDGKPMTFTLTPILRDLAQARPVEIKGWGVTCSDLTATEARERRAPDKDGALVTTIAPGGPASDAQPPLKEDDVILAVGGQKVRNVASLRAQTDKLPPADGGTPTLVEFRRDGERLLTVVSVGKQASDDTSVEVAKAWLPVAVQVATPSLIRALNLPGTTHGVRVTQLYREVAPETAAKFQIGDIITHLDEAPVEATQAEETDVFYAMLRQYKIGTTAKVRLIREGKPQILMVATVRAPRQERELPRYIDETFGLTIRSVSYKDRADLDAAPGEQGALIVDVAKGSWAALAGLHQGDIIHRIDGTTVMGRDDTEAHLKALAAAKPRAVTFFVARGVHTLFVELQTDNTLTAPPASSPSVPTTAAAPVLPTPFPTPKSRMIADPSADAIRSIVSKYRATSVTLLVVIKTSGSGAGDADNAELEIPGVVIDPSGLVVTTNAAIDPASTFANLDAEGAGRITTRVVSARILASDGGEDIPVKVVLRDSDRNLAFLRPIAPVASPMPFVDFKTAGKAQIGDPVYLLSHLGPIGNRQAQVNSLRIVSVLERPRTLYILESLGLAALGNVAFSERGEPLGMVTMRLSTSARRRSMTMNDNTLPIIVTAEDILEEAAQAPAASAVKDTPAVPPPAPKKPAASKKPGAR